MEAPSSKNCLLFVLPLTPRSESSSAFHAASASTPNASSPSDSPDSFGVTNKYAISPEPPTTSFSPVPPDSILYNDYVHKTPINDPSSTLNSGLYAMVPAEIAPVPREESEHSSYCLYIQMEYCADGSLRDFLNRRDAPLSVRMDYFRQVKERRRDED